ncbi:uncharacterized protein BX663DRAFT_547585 [Cokeromyces recurvatus]|uniref:uncharacterized protein n=1 Tax=Cokeromyces recurvatus TaxID=90255 RepID=UPI00221E5826|nr:uncharacterized protein BX663DRAFT_547585 [Cokeromyces recurvatus]KAI7907937.1 hypothetical protein BX663DRAFT_547585 [Cokeromyces recurvatus]
MLQELTDLDFDTYFDVTSNNQHSQTPNSHDILYHGDQQTNNNHHTLMNNNENQNRNLYYSQQQQQQQQQQTSFDFFNWNNLSSQSNLGRSSSMQISPISSPQSSSDGYTSHSLSPQMANGSPLYASFDTRNEPNKTLEGFFTKRNLFSSDHNLQNVPGINIPTTPISENNTTIHHGTITNLPSPPLDNNPLSGAYSAIDQWGQLKEQNNNSIHPLDKNTDQHTTRNWRKASVRHQQLHQSIPNTTLEYTRNFTEPGKQLKKVAHNAIERRYRNNINDRIRELKNVVPALYKARIKERGDDDDSSIDSGEDGNNNNEEIVEGVEVAKKLNKATILRKATEYINHLKHTNETTEQENIILQQIIAQMPGGQDVLSRFLCQKNEFKKSEQERLIRERREAQEREKLERQRILRERAAQRAALAQLLPKTERRPYQRRQSSKNSRKSQQSPTTEDNNGNKMFMAAFLCIVFFTAPSSSDKLNLPHHVNNQSSNTITRTLDTATSFSSSDFWYYARYAFYTFGIIYICLIPIFLRWLRPRPINRSKRCLTHHHYASEVPTAWSQLYTNLIAIVNKSTIVKPMTTHTTLLEILSMLYDIIIYSLSLLTPRFLLTIFHKNAKPVGCPEELAYIGAWIRLNEVECLGANPDITRLGLLHSCVGMLSQLHKMKRDERHVIYCEANTMARVYATTAMQLELCLPQFISTYITSFCWKRVISAMNQQQQQQQHVKKEDISKPSKTSSYQLITNEWLTSPCHDQVRYILQVRNGFITASGHDMIDSACRNTFYSFVLPYITSPLDLVLYWQQLSELEQCWHSYLNGTRPVFSEKQLNHVLLVSATTTAPAHMLQWWIRVGLVLESLSNSQDSLDVLAEYTRTQAISHPSSNLLRRHQSMILYLLEATTALRKHSQIEEVPQFLQSAMNDRSASLECINQIASITKNDNLEASVLTLSTLAVQLRTLKALIIHQQTTSADKNNDKDLLAIQASRYIAELRDQIMQDMESPCIKSSLSVKCKKHIQSYIAQADDTLSL